MYCNKCGEKIQDNHSFCSKCGAKVREVKLIPLFCPKCGGKIVIKEGQKIVDCGYCDNTFYFDDGVEKIEQKEYKYTHIHNHYNIDGAELERLLNNEMDDAWEKEMLEREQEYEMALLKERCKERKRKFVTTIVIVSALLILSIIFKNAIEDAFGMIGSILGNALVWVGVLAIIIIAIIL